MRSNQRKPFPAVRVQFLPCFVEPYSNLIFFEERHHTENPFTLLPVAVQLLCVIMCQLLPLFPFMWRHVAMDWYDKIL